MTTPEKIGRKEIAAAIKEKVAATGMAISQKVSEVATVAYEEVIQEALAEGKIVHLPGFGAFVPVKKAEAVKRNPSTGEDVTVPEHTVPKFKAGSKLKSALKNRI